MVPQRKRHNATLPIARLPPEIFLSIILATMEGGERVSTKHYPQQLHHLAQVCTDWASFIKTTPALWPCVSSSYETCMVKKAVSMHQTSAFDVCVNMHVGPEDFLPLVIPLSDQWRSLEVENLRPSHAHYLEDLILPNLQNVTIRAMTSCSIGLINRPTDLLRQLNLHRASIPWRHVQSSSFTSFIVSDIGDGTVSAHIMAMLQASPQLRTLQLARIKDSSSLDVPTPSKRVSLAHLKSLDIRRVSAPILHAILSHTIIPDRDCQILVDANPVPSEPSHCCSGQRLADWLSKMLRPAAAHATLADLCIDPDRCLSIEIIREGEDFIILEFDPSFIVQPLDLGWLIALLPHATPVQLSLEANLRAEEITSLITTLGHSLDSIHLKEVDSDETILAVLDWISIARRPTDPDTQTSHPSRSLRELILESTDIDVNTLVNSLTPRGTQGIALTVDETELLKLPLLVLRYDHWFEEEELERLQEAVVSVTIKESVKSNE